MTSDRPVPPQLIRQHLSSCEKRWEDQEKRTRELEKSMAETSLRLENGVKVFAEMRDDQNATATSFAQKVADLTPKPPSTSKVVSIVLTVVAMSGGALWGLSQLLHDRPTTEQIETIMNHHHTNGHRELKDLREVQIVQGAKIEGIDNAITDQSKKMDRLIKQTTPRKRSR